MRRPLTLLVDASDRRGPARGLTVEAPRACMRVVSGSQEAWRWLWSLPVRVHPCRMRSRRSERRRRGARALQPESARVEMRPCTGDPVQSIDEKTEGDLMSERVHQVGLVPVCELI